MQQYRPGDRPVPGYVLVEELGRGRLGEVWKASGPGRIEAALKIVRLGSGQGFNEFRALQRYRRLNHPNLVALLGLWLKDDQGRLFDSLDESVAPFLPTELIVARGLGRRTCATACASARGPATAASRPTSCCATSRTRRGPSTTSTSPSTTSARARSASSTATSSRPTS